MGDESEPLSGIADDSRVAASSPILYAKIDDVKGKEEDSRWPYLSPSRAGWSWVSGYREEIRFVLYKSITIDENAAGDPNEVVLSALEHLDLLMRSLETDVVALVTEAYFRGASWNEIAHRLGRAKQTVHQRYHTQVHAEKTHKSLRRDLADAYRRALELHTHDKNASELVSFVHKHAMRHVRQGLIGTGG